MDIKKDIMPALSQIMMRLPKTPIPAEPDPVKVRIDTIRRQRRKNLITRHQEIDQLLRLGIPVANATTIADNDDIRLTKAEE